MKTVGKAARPALDAEERLERFAADMRGMCRDVVMCLERQEGSFMVTVALLVRLEAKPGKETRVAAALMAKAPELLAQPPAIEKVDVLAAKLP